MNNKTTIHRITKNQNFTVLSNDLINDSRLDFRDIGVITYLLSKPDVWIINQSEVMRSHNIGRASLRTSFQNLMDCGYITRVKNKTEDGEYFWDYTVFESPNHKNESKNGDSSEFHQGLVSTAGYPPLDTNLLIKTYEVSTKEQNNDNRLEILDIEKIKDIMTSRNYKIRNSNISNYIVEVINAKVGKSFSKLNKDKFKAVGDIVWNNYKNIDVLANKLNTWVINEISIINTSKVEKQVESVPAPQVTQNINGWNVKIDCDEGYTVTKYGIELWIPNKHRTNISLHVSRIMSVLSNSKIEITTFTNKELFNRLKNINTDNLSINEYLELIEVIAKENI
jgi:hypothetical protein